MKYIFKLKRYLNFERVLPFALSFVLSLLGANFNAVHKAMGQVPQEESYISLNVKNQPLGDVLMKIGRETGYQIKLNGQWSDYPVHALLEHVPLDQVLKRILGRLNHTIIYESDKSINIVIYGEADSRKTDTYPVPSFSSQIQNYQQEPESSPELSPEKANDPERADESSKETDASGNTEEKSTIEKDSEENAEKEIAEKVSAVEDGESNKDSSSQSEDSNEQNEQGKAEENAAPDSPQQPN